MRVFWRSLAVAIGLNVIFWLLTFVTRDELLTLLMFPGIMPAYLLGVPNETIFLLVMFAVNLAIWTGLIFLVMLMIGWVVEKSGKRA